MAVNLYTQFTVDINLNVGMLVDEGIDLQLIIGCDLEVGEGCR